MSCSTADRSSMRPFISPIYFNRGQVGLLPRLVRRVVTLWVSSTSNSRGWV